jgi:dienelactone hydrolase
MFRQYIERREREFHARNDNRKVLPFEWGTEHVGLAATPDPAGALREFAIRNTADSSAFYAHEPADLSEMTFDGALLTLPSAVETPYPENNTVWGRYFDGGRDLGVVVLPQWNCPWDGQVGLCRVLAKAGISALRLSLPYHHHRKPSGLERAEYLVSSNIGRTLAANRQAVLDARRAADWLLAMGHRRIGIVGTSIGSCIAFLTFAHDERFSTGAFIHVSGYFADVVWSGLSTAHVRRAFEGAGGIAGLDHLRELWMPISPIPFIPRLRNSTRPMLMLAGRYDLTFLPELTRQLFAELDRHGVTANRHWLHCGHYTMGQVPNSAIAGYRIVRFLKENPRKE